MTNRFIIIINFFPTNVQTDLQDVAVVLDLNILVVYKKKKKKKKNYIQKRIDKQINVLNVTVI